MKTASGAWHLTHADVDIALEDLVDMARALNPGQRAGLVPGLPLD